MSEPHGAVAAPSTFATRFAPRANSIGALRLLFACLVIVEHANPLGYGLPNPLAGFSHGQTHLGALAVSGFFVLSGLLVARSAQRQSLGRFAWHRALRIFPGFWVCLLLTAGVLGPLLWWIREDHLAGYWSAHPSPLSYVMTNWWTSMRQWGIGDLLTTTPYGQRIGRSVFDGSLWSLHYELLCYLGVAFLAVVGALRRRRELVLVAWGAVLGMTLVTWIPQDRFGAGPSGLPNVVVPLLGSFSGPLTLSLALTFLTGALAACYPERIRLNGWLAGGALAVTVLSMVFGGFDVVGSVAFAYFVLWLAIALPPSLHRVGVRQDFSYGIYIYAFPIQQVLSLVHVNRLGYPVYLAASFAGSVVAGACSWYLVEKPALRFKGLLARPSKRPEDEAHPAVPDGELAQRQAG